MTGHALYRLTAEQDFLNKVHAILTMPVKREKRAHTVRRVWPVVINGERKFYRIRYHYAPEIGYWACVKDNHGNLVLNTEAYCLASTVRQIVSEFMQTIDKGVWE